MVLFKQRRQTPARIEKALQDFWNDSPEYIQTLCNPEGFHRSQRKIIADLAAPQAWVLDIGSGTGANAGTLSQDVKYVGVDISIGLLQHTPADERASRHFVVGSSARLPFQANNFDIVAATYVLEHVVYPRQTLAEMVRVCKPGGRIVLIG